MLLGRADHDADWYVHDERTGEDVYAGPAPEHLFVAAETKEEAMVLVAKLCMRPNDTTRGRAMKLTHYIDLSQRNLGTIPDDIPRYIRTTADIPVTLKGEITRDPRTVGLERTSHPGSNAALAGQTVTP